MTEYILRFLIGGVAVSLFAVLGDVLRPKSFAGLFGAAPSIALSTLVITLVKNSPAYAAREGRAMIIGAAALLVFSILTCQLLARAKMTAMAAALFSCAVWLVLALGARFLLLG